MERPTPSSSKRATHRRRKSAHPKRFDGVVLRKADTVMLGDLVKYDHPSKPGFFGILESAFLDPCSGKRLIKVRHLVKAIETPFGSLIKQDPGVVFANAEETIVVHARHVRRLMSSEDSTLIFHPFMYSRESGMLSCL
jgi:hypothetical protein